MTQFLTATGAASPIENVPISSDQSRFDGIWRIIWRRRRWFSATLCFVGVIGVAALVLQKPVYTAHTTLMVTSRQPDLAVTDQVVRTTDPAVIRPPREVDVDGEIEFMRSQRVLAKVARDLGLAETPDFGGKTDEGKEGAVARLSRWTRSQLAAVSKFVTTEVARLTGFWDPTETAPSVAGDEEQRLTERLASRLKIEPIRRSTIVDVVYSGSDPILAAAITRAIGESYIEDRHAVRLQDAERAARWLNARTKQLEQQVSAAERAAETFRAKNSLQDGRDLSLLKTDMEKISSQAAAARIAKTIAITKLKAIEERVQRSGIAAALEVDGSNHTDRLRGSLADLRAKRASVRAERGVKDPEVSKLESELATAQAEVVNEAKARLSNSRTEVTIAEQQTQMFESALRSLREEIDRLNAADVTLRSLERDAAAYRAVYEAFLERTKFTEQVGFNEAESWMVSPARPPSDPSSPKVLVAIAVTLGVGIAAATAVVLLIELRARQTVLSSQQFFELGLPTLGLVPDAGRHVVTLKRTLDYVTETRSAYSEAIEAVHTSMLARGFKGSTSSMVLMITSALPFEGKSTTAAALAAAIAKSDKRVLLIDADLRAPKLHRAFGVTRAWGLADCTDSQHQSRRGRRKRRLDDTILVDRQTGISFLAAGSACSNPQKVLRSREFQEALTVWREIYDFILIDTPPVFAVSDARILGRAVDYCVFVARWGKTRLKSVSHAVHLLEESGVDVAGTIISRVNVKRLATYEFADSEVYHQAYHRYLTAPPTRTSGHRTWQWHLGSIRLKGRLKPLEKGRTRSTDLLARE
jgi:polysaccharide biosynthesis transport protein